MQTLGRKTTQSPPGKSCQVQAHFINFSTTPNVPCNKQASFRKWGCAPHNGWALLVLFVICPGWGGGRVISSPCCVDWDLHGNQGHEEGVVPALHSERDAFGLMPHSSSPYPGNAQRGCSRQSQQSKQPVTQEISSPSPALTLCRKLNLCLAGLKGHQRTRESNRYLPTTLIFAVFSLHF